MIYLDNAATTLMDPEIISSLQGYMHGHFANSGAVYEIGLDAKKKIEEATESIEIPLVFPILIILFIQVAEQNQITFLLKVFVSRIIK